ncbi:MAG TPA: HEAT repeat domain-containing protein [Prolixibacteraceae bacterium]|nr:HEAT repeat domain-containing protein [Prolixibacteraceae bacterium]
MNQKTDEIIIKNLYSNKLNNALEAVEQIAQTGNSQYIPMLIDVLFQNENQEVSERIIKLLSEVKHTDTIEPIVKAIETEKYASIQEVLVRICWENGLDYSNYLSTFVELLIYSDYMVAFEAFTLIENCEGKISETSAREYIDRLQTALSSANKERKTLLEHIIQFIPSLTSNT